MSVVAKCKSCDGWYMDRIEVDGLCLSCVKTLLSKQQHEIDRLTVIVERLPKTADGVVITKFLEVFFIDGLEGNVVNSGGVFAINMEDEEAWGHVRTYDGGELELAECDLYSTREAVIEAAERT